MRDKTTEGYEAVAADVDGLLRNSSGYYLAEPDPLERWSPPSGANAGAHCPSSPRQATR
jgi:hypothetical protein